uniref:Uncharacterized protein n=1 Tax=Rhizophora mucronata TaxID=61149 RepID=A0A2P2J0J6_RHIMU
MLMSLCSPKFGIRSKFRKLYSRLRNRFLFRVGSDCDCIGSNLIPFLVVLPLAVHICIPQLV